MMVPTATYRLQFNSMFTFKSALGIAEYLSQLGVSTIYASPIFKTRAASTHGYDIVEPGEFNPQLGSQEDFDLLIEALNKCNMSWLQDIVPNHMAFSYENNLLRDLLENGERSEYYEFFDIDWDYPGGRLRGKLLAPLLGRTYKECLEGGELRVEYDERGFTVSYYDLRLPLSIESYLDVMGDGYDEEKPTPGSEASGYRGLLGVAEALRSLPSESDRKRRRERADWIKRRLWELYTEHSDVRSSIDGRVKALNGAPGAPESFSALDKLLDKQIYRLSHWSAALEEINYRRFFDINELISLRMEAHPFPHPRAYRRGKNKGVKSRPHRWAV